MSPSISVSPLLALLLLLPPLHRSSARMLVGCGCNSCPAFLALHSPCARQTATRAACIVRALSRITSCSPGFVGHPNLVRVPKLDSPCACLDSSLPRLHHHPGKVWESGAELVVCVGPGLACACSVMHANASTGGSKEPQKTSRAHHP
ncbi:hypothetical protein BR93DRAFT_270450 [Coniochaeta sp. PMI_546]|nr:hypothetical protein BR93DRAFT_270450 [Coniochaeta sp. PMI_546]